MLDDLNCIKMLVPTAKLVKVAFQYWYSDCRVRQTILHILKGIDRPKWFICVVLCAIRKHFDQIHSLVVINFYIALYLLIIL